VTKVVIVCEAFASKQSNRIDIIFISIQLKFWVKRYIPMSLIFFCKEMGHTKNRKCIYRYGRNSELIINTNKILLKVVVTNFSTSQFTMVVNFFLCESYAYWTVHHLDI